MIRYVLTSADQTASKADAAVTERCFSGMLESHQELKIVTNESSILNEYVLSLQR